MEGSHDFDARLWLYPGKAGWVFATLPTGVADDILDHSPAAGGFGSIRVTVRVGVTEWSTSLFPDRSSGSFVLPIKRAVRKAAGIDIGDTVHFSLSVADPG